MKNLKEVEKHISKSTPYTIDKSGIAMDRKITPPKHPVQKIVFVITFICCIGFLIYTLITSPSGKSLTVNNNEIIISSVTKGVFEDFIPVRARVIPAKTLYLDAIEGGRVERIFVEDGANLTTGDLIVELSNPSLQINVLGNEARVAEQLNNMRTIELNLEQNRLQHKRNLVDIHYQIKILTRQLKREHNLVSSGAVPQTKFEDTQDTLEWYQNRLDITLESQKSDHKMQQSQLTFLKETSTRLEDNLAISRQNLDNMNVKAPVAGKLSGFDVEVGQSIGAGQRLGQIDTPDDYKLAANIDEFYLSRIDLGQHAKYKGYQLVITKIYPQVQNSLFRVDFSFIGEQPKDIRRGQTLQTKLTLGDDDNTLLLPNEAFYQSSGGHWVFVVSADKQQAVKRDVSLGRRNNQFIEVLSGLTEDEQVITSGYSTYKEVEQLKLSQ